LNNAADWRQRLRSLLSFPESDHVRRFLHNDVVPALKEFASELERYDVRGAGGGARRRSQTACVWRCCNGDETDFVYEVRCREHAVPDMNTWAMADRYYRAEVHLAQGGQDYCVMGWSREQITLDALKQYDQPPGVPAEHALAEGSVPWPQRPVFAAAPGRVAPQDSLKAIHGSLRRAVPALKGLAVLPGQHRSVAELQPGKARVERVAFEEFVVGAEGHHPAFIHHGDTIGVADRGQAVGDDDRGAFVHQFRDSQLYLVLALGVQGTGGLVQEQDLRIHEHGPGQGHALALAAGQAHAAFAEIAVVALGEGTDEVVGVGAAGGSSISSRLASGRPYAML
jgi:hypothetical protein